jgi:uncharacterized protein YecA (UPF0149 family)
MSLGAVSLRPGIASQPTLRRIGERVSRNDRCPRGSKKKYN